MTAPEPAPPAVWWSPSARQVFLPERASAQPLVAELPDDAVRLVPDPAWAADVDLHDAAMRASIRARDEWRARQAGPLHNRAYRPECMHIAQAVLDVVRSAGPVPDPGPACDRYCDWPGCQSHVNPVDGPVPHGWLRSRRLFLCPEHSGRDHWADYFKTEDGADVAGVWCTCGHRWNERPVNLNVLRAWWQQHVGTLDRASSGDTGQPAEAEHVVTQHWDHEGGDVLSRTCSCGERWGADLERCPADDSPDLGEQPPAVWWSPSVRHGGGLIWEHPHYGGLHDVRDVPMGDGIKLPADAVRLVPADDELRVPADVLISATRYALGRSTYVVGDTVEQVVRHADRLSERVLTVLIRDIESSRAAERGMDCDVRAWRRALDTLRAALARHTEETRP